jgi:hypothetical protein
MPRLALKKRPGLLFWLESALAAVSAFLAVLTLVWRDWAESIFGLDPDHGNGSFEWELVVTCCLLAVLFSALARQQWRKAALATT